MKLYFDVFLLSCGILDNPAVSCSILQYPAVIRLTEGDGGGGNSFANITLAISSRCFSILLLSLGAFHKVLDLRASLLQKVFVLLRVYLLENLNLILIFYKSFC